MPFLWRRWLWRLAAAINMALTGNADLGTFASQYVQSRDS